ncbi:MAG TPA: 30S ribosomal protein S4 [Bacteroidota bacterium]|nr:30S ribosomal protein S4 [Bacteroidota bacterium]
MKYNGPKVKLSRQLGIPLTPKASKIMERKPHPPGAHGLSRNRRAKVSDYKRQLLEKQRLRWQYNISEKQMRNYYEKASRKTGNTADNLATLLETRLDAVVFRGGLARTIHAARQYVTHGHVEVNGQRVNIPSYHVRVNDVISVRQKSRKIAMFNDAVKLSRPPEYLDTNKPELSITVLAQPDRERIPVVCEFPLVIEYYSR